MMGISTRPSVSIAREPLMKITLDEKSCEKDEDSRSIWRNGDTIYGALVVTTSTVMAYDICIVLEGLLKIAIVNSGNNYTLLDQITSKAQHQFLRVCQHFKIDGQDPNSPLTHKFAFHFTIPHQLLTEPWNPHQQLLNLPPSVRKDEALVSISGKQSLMQPSVSYSIHAKLKPKALVQGETRMTTRTSPRELQIRPLNPATPPLVIEHYPNEYIMLCKSPVRLLRWQKPFGELKASMAEPLPINSFTSAPKGSTTGLLSLDFHPFHVLSIETRPEMWTVSVTSWLNIKTFCSTKHYTRIPCMGELENNPNLRFGSKLGKPEKREFRSLTWKLPGLPSYSKSGVGARWLGTTMRVPISIPKSMLPTFVTPLAARTYSLKVKITIIGVQHQDLILDVPLQVINDDVEKRTRISEELPLPELLCREVTSSEEVTLQDGPEKPPGYDRCSHQTFITV